jgi:hypothetical protein
MITIIAERGAEDSWPVVVREEVSSETDGGTESVIVGHPYQTSEHRRDAQSKAAASP